MDDRLIELLEKLQHVENEVLHEIQRKEQEFFYQIHKKKVSFEQDAKKVHKKLIKKVRHYLQDASIKNILTAPIIWSCLIPALLMDLIITVFQEICFPIYGIPKVRRNDYIVLDRQYLSYLNGIERLNCVYCGYFNGVMGYAREIAGRAEQYWCPIKHARKIKSIHSRYKSFFDYGDAAGYRAKIEEVRRSFDDIK
jgi:hypothetical protein